MPHGNMSQDKLKAVVEQTATPFYIYDIEQLKKNIGNLKNAFKDIPVHFSLKSNPSAALCKIMSSEGIQAEIASPFEARTAVNAGFDPAQILFDGPAKTVENISEILKLGIRRFNIESLGELKRLKQITDGDNDGLSICFRINPLEPSEAAEKMTGKPSRFGIDLEELSSAFDAADEYGFEINGIHLYLGSQILSNEQLAANYRQGLDIISENLDRFSKNGKIVYIFGAGFGIPYKDEESPLDLKCIAASFEKLRKDYALDGRIETGMECGRYLIGNTGCYVSKVVDVKISRAEKFITIDGGINHFLRYVLTGAVHNIYLLRSSSAELEKAEICGQTCTPYDVVSVAELPSDIAIDDILVLEDAGAYGWSMGMQDFLSFPSCAELILEDNNFKVIRRRSTFEDFSALNLD
jgi:diaminopimelate decarboxylase